MDKVVELYTLIAERCENTGARHQARVYREMIDFMADCETPEQATEKIKGSPYFLAPSVALMKDKLTALMGAAHENGMPAVADVYAKKLTEIDDDSAAIYQSGYERTAQNLKIRYIQTMEAFGRIYQTYLMLRGCVANDSVEIQHSMQGIREAFGQLEMPSTDFAQLTTLPSFRALIPATDAGYYRFISEAMAYANYGPNHQQEQADIEAEAQAVWGSVAQHKDEIRANGARIMASAGEAYVTVVAPPDATGVYTFIDEEMRA